MNEEDMTSGGGRTMTCDNCWWADQWQDYLRAPRIHIQCLQTQLGGSLSQRGCQRRRVDTARTSPSPLDTQDWGERGGFQWSYFIMKKHENSREWYRVTGTSFCWFLPIVSTVIVLDRGRNHNSHTTKSKTFLHGHVPPQLREELLDSLVIFQVYKSTAC